MNKTRGLIYGVGINDADYVVAKRVGNKQICCPIYTRWRAMLHRCYGSKVLAYNKAYIGCTVCDDWIYFSKFRSWVLDQENWQDEVELDKDLLVEGNRVYGPNTCLFVPKVINNFFTQYKENPDIGIRYFPNRKKPWRASVGSGKRNDKWFAYFPTKEEARLAYFQEKVRRGEEILKTLNEGKTKTAFTEALLKFKDLGQVRE